MVDWDQARKCPGCPNERDPDGGTVQPGIRHIRCKKCRAKHTRDKAADAQWDRRRRQREADYARREARGERVYRVRTKPRKYTPTWDQYGREVQPGPRLTGPEVERLRFRLTTLEQAIADVRAALDPPPR